MKNILYLIVLLCFIDLFEVKSDEIDDEISSQLNFDMKKIINEKFNKKNNTAVFKLNLWNNGNFGRKISNNLRVEKSLWNDDKINSINRATNLDIDNKYDEEEEEELFSIPSSVLKPPFKFYSSSIHNLATEDIEKLSTTTIESSNKSEINSLHIYEIAPSNLSKSNSKNNNNTNTENSERSFVINDPRKELKLFDSLRSSIINRQQTGNYQQHGNNYNINNNINNNYEKQWIDNKLIHTSRGNVIRANRFFIKRNGNNKSFYLNRGNRKYQPAVDSDERIFVSDTIKSYPTGDKYTWKSVQPINQQSFESNGINYGSVPGVPGRDYPVHHQTYRNHLYNIAARHFCPRNSEAHVYLADRESQCQIFYVCFNGDIGLPMICPNGTLFNEELQVCDWWYNVKC